MMKKEKLDNSNMIKKPFVNYTLDEDKIGKKDKFTVRINTEERKWLEEIKEDLNIASDSKALKFSALIGKNVLQRTFSRDILKYLFKKDRKKLEDIKNF